MATKDSFRYKKVKSSYHSKAKTKECDQNKLCFSDHIRILFCKQASLKVDTKFLLKIKAHQKLTFQVSFSDHSGMLIPSPATCFLEVNTRVSLKLATIRHFKGKKTLKNNTFEALF